MEHKERPPAWAAYYEETPEERFGRAVRRLREGRGLSQARLAELMTLGGVPMTQSQIAKSENGDRPIRLNEAVIFAFAFNESLDYLMTAGFGGPAVDQVDELEDQLAELGHQREDLQRREREVLEQMQRAKADAAQLWREQPPVPVPPKRRRS